MKAEFGMILVLMVVIVVIVALFVLYALLHGGTVGQGLDNLWHSIRNISLSG